MLAVLIVTVFLDNIDWERASQFREKREPFCQTFLATFRLLKDWRLLALIPLTLYSGFEQSFLSGEYTKAGPPRPPLRQHLRENVPTVPKELRVSAELRDVRVGHPLCGLCDDVLRSSEFRLLLPFRKTGSIHGETGPRLPG